MIEYRSARREDFAKIRELLAQNGWDRRVADEDRFVTMIENASTAIVALDGGRIVGFARALTDRASNGYIGTVVVAVEYRGKGIGSDMVQNLMGEDPDITWVLRAGHASTEFWRKMGFSESSVAMERTRR